MSPHFTSSVPCSKIPKMSDMKGTMSQRLRVLDHHYDFMYF